MQLSLSPSIDTGSSGRPAKRAKREQAAPQWAIETVPGSGVLLTMADAPHRYRTAYDPRASHVLLIGTRRGARCVAEAVRQGNIHPRAHSVRVACTVRITGKG